MSNNQIKLDNLQRQITKNNICPQLSATATNLVFGSGNVNADIVFVGEAPGKNEDILGLPFVGASGRFLDEMLGIIGQNRSDVYITNIVKYRPPNNRDPLPSEKADFLPYLIKQINIINPKLIITLGRHSMNVFLPGLSIGQVHGQVQKYGKRLLLPLYHPAAAMYNGSLKKILIQDFAKIPQILIAI